MKNKMHATAAVIAAICPMVSFALGVVAGPEREPVDALLVVQNHVSDDFRRPLSDLGDRIAAALSGDVFHVIDPNDAVGDNLNRGPWGENLPESSAVRLAENLDAPVLITASVGEASVVGIGNPPVAQCVRMTLTLSAKQLPKGAGFASVTVTEKSPNMTPEVLAQNADSVYSDLVGKLVASASAQFLKKAATARPAGETGAITVFFGCNVLGADVVIDGLSYGTCPGEFSVSPGVHSVLVSYPPYYQEFRRDAKLTENGQTFAIVLQITPEGERQRMGALDYERKRAELALWKREQDLEIAGKGVDVDKKKRELDFEFERRKRELDREMAEGSELFQKQLELADAMLERYALSGEADDYVRKTIADGVSVYWQNSYGRIAITDGEAGNIEFATPATDAGDLAVPPAPKDIGDGLQKLLMKRVGR